MSTAHYTLCLFADLPQGQGAHIQVPEHPGVQDGQEAGHSGPALAGQTLSPTAAHR